MLRPVIGILLALLTAAPAGAQPFERFAGRGCSDNTTGANAVLTPDHLAYSAGGLVIADQTVGCRSVRLIGPDGKLTTLATPSGANAIPIGVDRNAAGHTLFTTQDRILYEILPGGTFMPRLMTGITAPQGVAYDTDEVAAYVTDNLGGLGGALWRKATSTSAPVAVIPSSPRRIMNPLDVEVYNGRPYIADTGYNRIVKVEADGSLKVVAGPAIGACDGGGSCTSDATCHAAGKGNCRFASGDTGDGGPATAALFNRPTGLGISATGQICVADNGNNRVRCFTEGGNIFAVMGNGSLVTGGAPIPIPFSSEALEFPVGNPRDVVILPNGRVLATSVNDRMIYGEQLSAAPPTAAATQTSTSTIALPTFTVTRAATSTPVPPTVTATSLPTCGPPDPTATAGPTATATRPCIPRAPT